MADVVPFSVELTSERVGEERGVILHRIILTDLQPSGGIWVEEYGSKEQAEAFLRGVKAAIAMYGHLTLDIPVVQEPNWVH